MTNTPNTETPKPFEPTGKRAMVAIMASPDDLDQLRELFSSIDRESEAYPLARRMMKAVHRARRKLGFEWEC